MMASHSSVLNCKLSKHLGLFWHMLGWQHTNICANPQNLFARNGIAVECSAVEEDEVARLGIDFDAVSQGFLLFLVIREFIPVSFVVLHSMLSEPLLVNQVGFGAADEASLALTRIAQGLDSLVAPDVSVDRSLVAVQKGVDWPILIVPLAIHEAEAIKGCPQLIGLPQFRKQRHCSLPQIPLRFGVADVLNHASVQNRRVVFAQNMGVGVVPVERPIGKHLHDAPKVLDIFIAVSLGNVVGNDNKPFTPQVLSPTLLILKRKPIVSNLFLHLKDLYNV